MDKLHYLIDYMTSECDTRIYVRYSHQIQELVDCSDLPFSNALWSDGIPRSVSSLVSKGSKIFGSSTERNFS